jgi:hypothetical protein
LACASRAELAKEQNPVLGYYDPIGLADVDLWGQGEEASIGARLNASIERAAGQRRGGWGEHLHV